MRRTVTLFATGLLAGAAALTAPAAGAAESTTPNTPSAGAQATGSCSVVRSGNGYLGTCTGIDPQQTWRLTVSCQGFDSNGFPTSMGSSSNWVTGNTSASAGCFYPMMPSYGWIVTGSPVPAGPVGPISGYANKCVDVRGGNSGAGTPVQIYDCLGNAAQTWKVGTDGTIRALGKCLDVSGGNTGNATRVQIYDCNGTGAQQWQARPDGSLLNPQSGRCLDDLGYSTTNGNQLGIWDCNGAANQKWNLPA
ncbi:ricin-type beta-trefoil lectin domain protein [Kitasatospora sp. NPDC059577]|uniref:ricin-type beta-trefoil lectin domain protein n=1 Tax=Kitasatospora sp. NPDC059577 TaxID=3346873 RepID=UPI0036B32447